MAGSKTWRTRRRTTKRQSHVCRTEPRWQTKMKLGRPFVGRAGKYLTKTLAEYGIKREDLYITNIVKHASPKTANPSRRSRRMPTLSNHPNQHHKTQNHRAAWRIGQRNPPIDGIEYLRGHSSFSGYAVYKMRRKVQDANCRVGEKIKTQK